MKISIIERPWSWKRLSALFIVALLLFVAVRWQPGPWLRDSVLDLANQKGLHINFRTMRISGLTVHMEGVSMNIPGHPLMLDSLTVSPDWPALLTGHRGLRVGLAWHGQTVRAAIVIRKGYTAIHHLNANLDISALQHFWQQMLALPLNLSGRLHIGGDIRLDAATGRPIGGKLAADWKHVAIAMAGKKYPFGAYRLVINDGDTSGVWQWKLDGGTAVLLHGSGALKTLTADPAAWTMTGEAEVRAGQGIDPGLAGLLGSAPIRLRLSGNMAMPRLQRL